MTAVPYQATCVALGAADAPRGLLIEGPPGIGKSSLALALIDRGARLVGDDGVILEIRDARLWAAPPPNIRGLIEIRNVGLATLPVCEAPVALVVRLDPDAPRLPEAPEQVELAGMTAPMIRLHPSSGPLPLRAEWAVSLHGTK